MTLRERVASALRRLADRLDPHPFSSEEALRRLPVLAAGFEAAWTFAWRFAERINAATKAAKKKRQ